MWYWIIWLGLGKDYNTGKMKGCTNLLVIQFLVHPKNLCYDYCLHIDLKPVDYDSWKCIVIGYD